MKYSYIFLVLVILFFESCSSNSFVSIRQNGKNFNLRSTGQNSISLERAPFHISALLKPYEEKSGQFYSIKAIVSETDDIFKKINAGDEINDASPFGNGKGIAIHPTDSALFIDNGGYNYLYYEPQNEQNSPMKKVQEEGRYYEVDGIIIGINNGESRNAIE